MPSEISAGIGKHVLFTLLTTWDQTLSKVYLIQNPLLAINSEQNYYWYIQNQIQKPNTKTNFEKNFIDRIKTKDVLIFSQIHYHYWNFPRWILLLQKKKYMSRLETWFDSSIKYIPPDKI